MKIARRTKSAIKGLMFLCIFHVILNFFPRSVITSFRVRSMQAILSLSLSVVSCPLLYELL